MADFAQFWISLCIEEKFALFFLLQGKTTFTSPHSRLSISASFLTGVILYLKRFQDVHMKVSANEICGVKNRKDI